MQGGSRRGLIGGQLNEDWRSRDPMSPEPAGWEQEVAGSSGPDGYRLVRVLKGSEGIKTLLAVNLDTGKDVVIKMTAATLLSAEARIRLEHEAAVLRRLESPWLAPVLDVGYEADHLYVVMPLIPGVTLQERLANGRLDVSEALTVASCLLSALTEVHDHGVLHGDVKPANVIVDMDSPLERATLIDFDLARSAALAPVLRNRHTGTARYMAPEQAGLVDRTVDERSDLYSVGIVLFECLSGRPPFDAATIGEVLRHQVSTPAPSLRSLEIPVPQALEEILQRLLRKDPDDRYQSAPAALSDIAGVADALARGIREPDVVVGAHDWRQTLAEPALVGRESELARLERQLEDASHGGGRLVILEANSGGGKTRLLDEFCQRAAGSGAWVLRGYGLERAAPRPLQMLAGVIADLLDTIGTSPGLAALLAERLGEARVTLCEVLPELRDTLGVSATEAAGPAAYGQTRGVSALVALLDALGSTERPAVVVLDDCQWADEFTLRGLVAWAGRSLGSEEPSRSVLIVAAVRPEELGHQHPLRELTSALRLKLPPLAADEIQQVIHSMAGPVPEKAAEVVVQLSRGNPFMVSAVLLGLMEAGALASGPRGWQFESGPASWQASREAAVFLARRLELLAPSTRRVLEAGAVLGREFELPLAAVLAEQAEEEAGKAIAQAVERHVVWRRDTQRCSFVHDRLRETLLSSLERSQLAKLHLRAAEEIEATDPSRNFELAYHFDAAGEPQRALKYALKSGEVARSRHDLELAEGHYRIAERGMSAADHATRQAVAEALGQILMLRGRYEEAGERLELARSLAQDEVSAARIEAQLGELAFKRDELDAAAERIETAVKVLGESVPRGGLSLALFVCRDILLRFGRVFRRRRHRASEKDQERLRLAAHLLARLQYAWWFRRRRLATVWVMLRHVNVAERCPGSPELAHTYAIYGAGMALTFPFLHRRGLRYVDRAMALHEQEGNLWGEGQAWGMRTCVLHAAGRFSEAVDASGRAARLLEQAGDPWELNFAARNRALCLLRLGRLREAVDEARRMHQAGIEIGDAQAEASALEIWAKATGGQLADDPIEAALRHIGADIEVSAAVLQAQALRLRASGLLSEAIATLEEAVRMVGRSGERNIYVVPVFSWIATLYREAVEQGPWQLPATRRRLLRRARRAARRALRYARLYPNDLPHALREAAMVAAFAGHARRARRLFDRSAKVAERHQARAEQAETLRQRERLGIPSLRYRPRSGVADGQMLPEAETVARQPTLALVERFATLLEAGGRLAKAASSDELASAVRETALTLLRAEQCVVVRIGSEADGESADGIEVGHSSGRTLAERALERRRPIVLTEALAQDGSVSDSLVLAGVRSALCAPILVGDEIWGYFLASHYQVGRLFGEEDERLAEFIAHMAGAALERERLQREIRAGTVAAQEGERARVARDLHDEIGQALTSVLLGVHLIEGSMRDPALDVEQVLTRVRELRHAVGEALEQVQRLAFDLRPTVLDDVGLVAALRRLVSDVGSRHGIAVQLDAGGLGITDRLPPDVETTAYRVVQESLTNVVRHSCASMCSVVLALAPKRFRLVVEDDGIGFDPSTRPARGLGLRGMSERAALLGGTLRVTSSAGQGTQILLEVPLG